MIILHLWMLYRGFVNTSLGCSGVQNISFKSFNQLICGKDILINPQSNFELCALYKYLIRRLKGRVF